MSLTSRILFGVGLALVLLACSVDAHGWMAYPKPRGQYTSPPKPSYVEYAPATTNPDDVSFVCRNDPVMPKASWLPLTAGESQSITLQFNALHVGDCFVYLTYDGDKPINEMKWFKIWEQHACKNSNNYNIPIPSYLPSGEHVIFRWEWYALHVYPTVEYYSQCVDATMSGSASGSLPSPQVSMPGHLPHLSGDVMDDTNNYWWPWDNQPMMFTGPALATLNGQQSAKPTNAPATSAPVTSAPIKPTNAPATSAPKPTYAPATAPPTAPTTRPTPPTLPPAPIKPTAAATSAPKPTSSAVPTDRKSVKLNVLEASSAWWFAAAVTGSKAEEIVKVEIKDSGAFSTYTPMSYGWSTVWVFAPTSSAITYPLTVKASLASGSSLTFTVNNKSASTIDSGSLFA